MNKYQKAACIGYYRMLSEMPNKWEILCWITDFDIVTIKIELARYLGRKAIAL